MQARPPHFPSPPAELALLQPRRPRLVPGAPPKQAGARRRLSCTIHRSAGHGAQVAQNKPHRRGAPGVRRPAGRPRERARKGPTSPPLQYSILALIAGFPKRPLGTPVHGHFHRLLSKAIAIPQTKTGPGFPLHSAGLLCGQEPCSVPFRAGANKLFCTKTKSEKNIGPNF